MSREPRFISGLAALIGRAALREKPFSPLVILSGLLTLNVSGQSQPKFVLNVT